MVVYGAADQQQLDIYGEGLDSIYFMDQSGLTAGHQGWLRISDMLNWAVDNWDQPEEGTWETRGRRQDFTYGRLMNWVALDRGIRLATRHARPAPVDRWRAQRDAIYNSESSGGGPGGIGLGSSTAESSWFSSAPAEAPEES